MDSVEDCERLSALLDEQNPRICTYLEFLALLRSSQASAALELKAFVDSDEFLKLLAGSEDGAQLVSQAEMPTALGLTRR